MLISWFGLRVDFSQCTKPATNFVEKPIKLHLCFAKSGMCTVGTRYNSIYHPSLKKLLRRNRKNHRHRSLTQKAEGDTMTKGLESSIPKRTISTAGAMQPKLKAITENNPLKILQISIMCVNSQLTIRISYLAPST